MKKLIVSLSIIIALLLQLSACNQTHESRSKEALIEFLSAYSEARFSDMVTLTNDNTIDYLGGAADTENFYKFVYSLTGPIVDYTISNATVITKDRGPATVSFEVLVSYNNHNVSDTYIVSKSEDKQYRVEAFGLSAYNEEIKSIEKTRVIVYNFFNAYSNSDYDDLLTLLSDSIIESAGGEKNLIAYLETVRLLRGDIHDYELLDAAKTNDGYKIFYNCNYENMQNAEDVFVIAVNNDNTYTITGFKDFLFDLFVPVSERFCGSLVDRQYESAMDNFLPSAQASYNPESIAELFEPYIQQYGPIHQVTRTSANIKRENLDSGIRIYFEFGYDVRFESKTASLTIMYGVEGDQAGIYAVSLK